MIPPPDINNFSPIVFTIVFLGSIGSTVITSTIIPIRIHIILIKQSHVITKTMHKHKRLVITR